MVLPASFNDLSYTIQVFDTAIGGNEAPKFDMESYTFTISEDVMNQHLIATLSVTDSDGTYYQE